MNPTLDTTTANSTPPVGNITQTLTQPISLVGTQTEGQSTPAELSLIGEQIPGLNTPAGLALEGEQATGVSTPLEGAVVSSEPAANLIEQDQTFIAQSTPGPVEDAGTTLFEEDTTPPPEGYEVAEPDMTDEEAEIEAMQTELDKNEEDIYNTLTDLQKRSDKITQQQISAIRGQYKQLANEAREISKRRQAGLRVMGFRAGRYQFAPEIQSGIITTEKQALVTNLGKIAALEAQAISEAQQAQMDREFQIANQKISFARDLRMEKRETLKELQAKMEEERELYRQMDVQNKVVEMIADGERDPFNIFKALKGKVSFEEVTAITDTYKAQEAAVEEAIGFAIQTGEATPEEIAFMNDKSRSYAERKTAAYQVAGRVAYEDRALDRSYKNAQIASIYSTIKARRDALKEAEVEANGELKNDSEGALNILTLANALKNHDKLELGTGTSAYLTFGMGGQLDDFNATHEQLKNLLTIDNLGLMSGVLSESDVRILANAATKLKPGLPTDQYIKELDTIINGVLNGENFTKAVNLGYVSDLDYALAMGYSNDDIADMKEMGLISFDVDIQDYSSNSPQGFYGTH